jgi:8-oxo-dGTP pyrophosphatase MutT (NUDIX family)
VPTLQFTPALRAAIATRLDAFAVQGGPATTHARAAVAVAVLEEGEGAELAGLSQPQGWSTQAALLLTRRAAGLSHHPGQWALPGGRIDPGEDAEDAALRELYEETGLVATRADVLGRLDDFSTRSGFAITPVVVWAEAARNLVANPAEVASIHRIRVDEFLREDAPMLEPIADSEHPVLRMPIGSGWIAAPTAAILYQFREVCVLGRATRVAHFEQPLFARR